MKKCLLLVVILCISAGLKAQTDTVAAKIRKIPVIHVDVLAKFPGGDFTKYIAANITYHKKSDRTLRGEVIVSMKIDSTGTVSNVNVLKTMTPDIDQEIAHVIKSSPKWTPAISKGKPIGVYMVFNIDMSVIGAMAAAKPKAEVPAPTVVSKPTTTPISKPPVQKEKTGPIVAATPPVTNNRPTLKAVKKPLPPYDKKPFSVEKKTTPPVVKNPVPKPAPPVEKKPVTAVVKKPVPPPAKKATPPVVKKPVPQVAKKIVLPPPVAKKIIPPAEKKPITQVAKTIPPPVVKKPVPQVAKQPVKPVAKKEITKPVAVKHKLTASKPVVSDDPLSKLGPSYDAQFLGQGGFDKYLEENINYPILSKVNRIEGVVNISFVVDKTGTITDIKILSSPADDLAQEAARVLLASPKWKPAMQNGVAVKRIFTKPIGFKLQDGKTTKQP